MRSTARAIGCALLLMLAVCWLSTPVSIQGVDGRPRIALDVRLSGTTSQASLFVPATHFRRLEVGDTVYVLRRSDAVAAWILAPQADLRALDGLTTLRAVLITFAGFALMLPLAVELDLRRQARLLRHGTSVDARITESKVLLSPGRTGSGRPYYRVRYVFAIDGRTHTGKADIWYWLAYPDVGRSICVLYDPRRPGMSRPAIALSGVSFLD